MRNYQREQDYFLKNNKSEIDAFEKSIMFMDGLPQTINTIIQLVNPLFYEWEFLYSYNKLFGAISNESSYANLFRSFAWDYKDSWKQKQESNIFSGSYIWEAQLEKNQEALTEAKKIGKFTEKEDKAAWFGIPNAISKLGDWAKYIPVILIGGLAVWTYSKVKK